MTLRVLIVDDSALVRQMFVTILSATPDLVPVVASNATSALAKIAEARPDVVVLDLEMPGMHGRALLRKLMAENPMPVVVCSARTTRGTDEALAALADGAVDVVAKPQLGLREFFEECASSLVEGIRAAAAAKLESRGVRAPRAAPREPVPEAIVDERVVVIGASTGGPQAIADILAALPRGAPPIAIAQHMPEAFTAAFARHLELTSGLRVREAASVDRLEPGLVLVAPGNRHLVVQRKTHRGCLVELVDGARVSGHRPSVDVLFRSAARVLGRAGIGVLLTGMGNDGAAGLAEMRTAGSLTIAQDEATSVVYGMPREAVARGAATRVLPLRDIATAIVGSVRRAS
jgi:two-component system chemotaxis response regulator CheB